jgi:PAS domain S-box-containing protein
MPTVNTDKRKEFHKLVVETIPNPVFYKDREGRYTGCNKAFEEFIGRPAEDIIGKTVYDMAPREIADEYFLKDQELYDNPGKQEYPWKVVNRAGEVREVTFHKATLVDEEGRVSGLVGVIVDMTESRRAEEKLRASEEEYRDLFDSANDMIQVVLPDGKLRYVNPSWCRTFGYSAEEAADLSVFDLIDGDCLNHCQATFGRVLAEGAVDHFETTFLSKDGKRIFIEGSATCRYEDGTPVYSRCFLRDVTEQEMAKRKLDEEKGLSEALINSLPGHFFLVDAEGRLKRWNRNVEVFTGYSTDEILRMNALDFFEGDEREHVAGKMREGFTRGEASTEASIVARDGKKTPFLYRATRIEVGGEYMLAGLGMDVSALKEAEERLAYSEKYLSSIIRNEPECVKLMDPDGTVLDMNPAGLAMLEADSPDQVIGQNLLDVLDPKYCKDFVDLSKKVCCGSKCSMEFEVVGLKGTRRWLETHSVPFEDEATGRTLILAVTRDITVRKGAEEDLIEAKRSLEYQNMELKKLDQMKDSLLRDVSHELKTPVAKHAMQLEILKPMFESLEVNAREVNAFQVMRESIRRQEGVIRNMLDLARLESGGRVYDRQAVSLESIISKVKEDYQDTFDFHEAEFTVRVPPLAVVGDSEMLWHVFSNIINNAIKFRRKDDRLKISVTAEQRDGEVLVRFTDNGIGLEEVEKQKLFTRFYQSSPSTEGSGVGLAISRRIVEDQGGQIWIDSEGPGKGAAVSVTLPLATSPP